MKKTILLFIGILVLGCLAIYFSHFLSDYKQSKEECKSFKSQAEHLTEQFKNIESNKDTIDQQEIPSDEMEIGQVDKNQVFFNNIEAIYKYLTFNQADQVKQKLQFYLQNNLNNIKECSIKTDTLKDNNMVLSFSVEIQNYKDIVVIVTKDNAGKVIDISITQSQ